MSNAPATKLVTIINHAAEPEHQLQNFEIIPTTTAEDLLMIAGLPGYVLSSPDGMHLSGRDLLWPQLPDDGGKLTAVPNAVVGDSLLRGLAMRVLRRVVFGVPKKTTVENSHPSTTPEVRTPAHSFRKPVAARAARSVMRLTLQPVGRLAKLVLPRPIPLWKERRWKRSEKDPNLLVGVFRMRYSGVRGVIKLKGGDAGDEPSFYVSEVPEALLKRVLRSRHGVCFRKRGAATYWVHFKTSRVSLDAGIAAIEAQLAECSEQKKGG